MDDQGRDELGDSVPGEEGASASDSDVGGQVHRFSYGLLEEGGVGEEGGDGDMVDQKLV